MTKPAAFFYFCALATISCFGSVVEPPQPVYLSKFVGGLEAAESEGHGMVLNKWSDIETLPLDLQVQMLGTHVQDRSNASDYFSIIPLTERSKFPHGSLLIISGAPFNLTAWLRAWYAKDRGYTAEQLEAFDKTNPDPEIIRWYVVKDSEGKYRRASISEDELTKIIEQTGLIIPKPSVYRFNMAQVDPATGKPINAPPSPATPVASTRAEPVSTPTPTLAPVDLPSVKSSTRAWWIIGIIVALVGVVWLALRKKPKA